MIYRIIIGNIIASLLTPVMASVRWIPNIFRAIFYKEYVYYNFEITSFTELIYTIYGNEYILATLFSGVIIFLPFQLIKSYFISHGTPLPFHKKVGLLSGMAAIVMVLFFLLGGFWPFIPWYKNLLYPLFTLLFGIIFTSLLHLIVDRYEEKKYSNLNSCSK